MARGVAAVPGQIAVHPRCPADLFAPGIWKAVMKTGGLRDFKKGGRLEWVS